MPEEKRPPEKVFGMVRAAQHEQAHRALLKLYKKEVLDCSLPDDNGNTLLHYLSSDISGALPQEEASTKANRREHIQKLTRIIRVARRCGADINAQDPFGRTPLMIAGARRDETTVFAMLQYGADPKLRNEAGLSAADYAGLNGRNGTVRLLEMAEAGTKGIEEKIRVGERHLAEETAKETPGPEMTP